MTAPQKSTRRANAYLVSALAMAFAVTSCSSSSGAAPADGPLEVVVEQNRQNPRKIATTALNLAKGDIQLGRWIGLYPADGGAEPAYVWVGCLDHDDASSDSLYTVGRSVTTPADCSGEMIVLEPTDSLSLELQLPPDQRGCFYLGFAGFRSESFEVEQGC